MEKIGEQLVHKENFYNIRIINTNKKLDTKSKHLIKNIKKLTDGLSNKNPKTKISEETKNNKKSIDKIDKKLSSKSSTNVENTSPNRKDKKQDNKKDKKQEDELKYYGYEK